MQQSLDLEVPVIHIASHFVFEPGNESASFLLLGDGTKINLKEMRYEFDFRHVELLTLSACETAVGGGKNAIGQEIEGFGALAQIEGAKAVIASLWNVSDDSTADFMEEFYRVKGANKGMSKIEAMKLAQISLLHGENYLREPFRGGAIGLKNDSKYSYSHP